MDIHSAQRPGSRLGTFRGRRISHVATRRAILLRAMPLTLAAGLLVACSDSTNPVDPPLTLAPGDSCREHPGTAVPTFADPGLQAAIEIFLPGDALTCSGLGQITALSVGSAGITSLVGLQNLSNLEILEVYDKTRNRFGT